MDTILSTPIYLFGVVCLLAVVAYIVYRSIFLVHAMLLAKESFVDAVVHSFQITKEIGLPRMLGLQFRTLFWSFLIMLPILVLLYGFSVWSLSWEVWFGSGAVFISSMVSWLASFLLVSIPGVLTLAMLTGAYMSHTKFSQREFLDTFHFVRTNPEFVPRFKNLRLLVEKKWALALTVIVTTVAVALLSLVARIDSPISDEVRIISHR